MKKVLCLTAVVIINILFAVSLGWPGQIELVKPGEVGMSGKVLSLIDEFAVNGIKAKYYKGAVVLVARHGQICYLKSYGEAREGQPMETDAIFRQASMTKPLVMAAFMQFYDQGRFNLDDPLAKFIPEFKDLQVAVDDGNGNITLAPAEREITMHDLMSYTAGFTCTFYYGLNPVNSHVTTCYAEQGVHDLFDDAYTHTLEDNVKAMAQCPLAFQPGEGWLYAHTSHDIIGYLIEQFSGMPLDKYMEQEIFIPLKMNETWFYPPENTFSRIPEVTIKHNSDASFVEKILGLLPEDQEYTFGKNKTYFSAGGGLHCTAYDYFRFAQMMLNKGELDGVRIVSEQAIELMTQPSADAYKVSGLTGNMWGYGVDVQVSEAPGGSGYWLGGQGSYGWRGIWSTLWNNNPANDTVVIMLTQVGDDGVFPYLYLINTFTSAAVLD
ncbi:MAG: serine hydrolase domain-containing protein [Candidatus Vecturithrix sp.]|jgi:CubicO group peptidase (beta-lactamase class C family)|nr:serine hydrolase domain-containing protein [Candidatus Vecturithrix sp.]